MEQTILEVIRNRGRKTQQASLPALQQKSNEITLAYGNREKFLSTFNPDVQRDICGNPDICFFGGAPTLGQLNATYGSQTAAMWLVPQLYNLSEYCGCKDKLEGNPLKECASVIATEFYFLSVSELMLFFHRFKSGRYGRFYGSVDPLVITTSLRDFLKERIRAYDEREKAEKEKADREAAKNAITWEEYCMKNFGELRTHPMLRKTEEEKKAAKAKKAEVKQSGYDKAIFEIAETIEFDEIVDKHTKQVFVEKFKKHHGLTPKEYIKKYGDRQDT
ncbi:MAG: hypothetical protein IKO37_06745 [Prevotella sp.]|nr:hypothetical protein [Prevotella sp.]